MQRLDLGHHRFVDREPAGGVDDQHIGVGLARIGDRGAHDVDRFLIGCRGKEQRVDLFGEGAQLVDRGRPVHVGRDHHHLLLAPLLQMLGELADRGGLARALQAGHQDDGRRRHVQREIARGRSHHRRELVTHDLDQRLARRQRLQYFLADRTHLDAFDQRLHHRQRDVGFEQRDAHVAGRFADVFLGQPSASTQTLDGRGQAGAERFEHGYRRRERDSRGREV
jgi:hypothetical protein